jgi:hypothetical protein
MKKTKNLHYLFAGFVATAVWTSTTTALADYAGSIEAGTSPKAGVTYDNASGSYPVVSAILSTPGTYTVGGGTHSYTTWAFDATDGTGSLDIFASKTVLTTAGYTPVVGTGVSATGTYSPFDGIPELETITAISAQPTSVAVPAPIVISVGGVAGSQSVQGSTTLNNKVLGNGLSSYIVELDNVKITSGFGSLANPSYATVFPNYQQANITTETYTVTDSGGNKGEMFDWVTSYSTDDLFGGTAVPTGPVDMTGFVDSFGEFVPMSITAVATPDATSTMAMLGIGSMVCLGVRRRFQK